MIRLHRALPACLLAFATAAAAVEAPPELDVLLEAEFETQALDAPIGTGGAAAGEPVEFTMDNRIVEHGITGHGLQLLDSGVSTAVSMRFEFLDGREMTQGMFHLTVWFEATTLDTFYIRLRENDSAAVDYGQVLFTPGGSIRLKDRTGDMGEVVAPGTIAVGDVHWMEWVHDLDAGTHSVYLDGAPLVEDRLHGQDGGPDGRGIGAVLFGYSSDAGTDGVFEIDMLDVLTDQVPRGDPVFASGFEGEAID